MHIILKSEKLPNCKMPPKSHNIYLFYFLDFKKVKNTSVLLSINNALERNRQNALITKIFIFSNKTEQRMVAIRQDRIYLYP